MPNEDFCWNDEPTDYDGMYYNLKSATIIQYTIKGRFMSR